ncbi:MAG: PH domain-containing protein [Deltaproteobacteria bacterium]|nr:PH domain-containing protein [Deltaproteobacteria bacterium]
MEQHSVSPLPQEAQSPAPTVIFRSLRSEIPALVILIALTVSSIWLTARFEWSVQRLALGEWLGYPISLPIPLFAILPITLGVFIVHSLYNYRYILCEDYVLEVSGLMDLQRRSVRLNYLHIRGVEIRASIWQQLVGVSDLIVLGPHAELEKATIEMKGIRNAHAVKDAINASIHTQLRTFGSGPIEAT